MATTVADQSHYPKPLQTLNRSHIELPNPAPFTSPPPPTPTPALTYRRWRHYSSAAQTKGGCPTCTFACVLSASASMPAACALHASRVSLPLLSILASLLPLPPCFLFCVRACVRACIDASRTCFRFVADLLVCPYMRYGRALSVLKKVPLHNRPLSP